MVANLSLKGILEIIRIGVVIKMATVKQGINKNFSESSILASPKDRDVMIKNAIHIVKKGNKWNIVKSGRLRSISTHTSKIEAISEARKIIKRGAIVVRGLKGDIESVIGPVIHRDSTNIIKEARVKHARSNEDVNIAIAKAIESRNG